MNRERIVSGLFFVIGLVFALLGQAYFTYEPGFWRDGVFFWCVSILAFVLLRWQLRRQRREQIYSSQGWQSKAAEHLPRALAALGGAGLTFVAGRTARQLSTTDSFWLPLLLWVIGVSLFLLAFVPLFSVRETWRYLVNRARAHRVELAGLAVLLLVALVVRVVDLEHIPVNFGGDEGTQGLAALELVAPPMGNPFSTGWFSVPTMSFLAYGIVMRVFGATITGLRLLSALIGTATVLTTFLLAREMWGRRVGWMAAVLLAFGHYHLHFSRLGSNQIGDAFFVTLALWLLAHGLRRRRLIDFALVGTVVGLAWYGYFGARLVGVIVAFYLVWLFVTGSHSRSEAMADAQYGRWALVPLAAALVVVMPLLLHYTAYPDTMASRANQVTILAPGWLVQEQAYTGRSAASILLQQFWKAISAFHYTVDPTFWYRPSIPFLDFVSGVLLLFGMVWAGIHWRESRNVLLLLWFWLAVILGWALTENPPSSQRLVIVTPALALLASLGLNWLVALGRRTFGRWPRLSWDTVADGLLVIVSVLNLYFYFIVYTPTGVYANPTAEVATRLGRYLAAQDDDDRVVYFYGAPQMYWTNGNLSFMARDIEGVDVYQPGDTDGAVPVVAHAARFVFLPHRLDELVAVEQQFPGGVEQPVYSNFDGRLLYVLYESADQ
jgi:4-amino-4-deoxy-L-arabinose transferase-like glycosyltransferase